MTVKFHSTTNQTNLFKNSINAVINRKSSLYGLEILLDGPSVVYLEPVFTEQNLVGVLEMKSVFEQQNNYKKTYYIR